MDKNKVLIHFDQMAEKKRKVIMGSNSISGVVFALFSVLFAGSLYSAEIPSAKKLISQYIDAALANQGDTVANCISKETFNIWDELLKYAKTATKTEIKSMSLYRQFTILWIRLKFKTADLQIMTGKSYISLSYKRGFNSKNAIENLKALTDSFTWQVREETGYAYIFYQINDEWKKISGLRLINDDGQWKIDGADQYKLVENKMTEQWQASGKSKDEYLKDFFLKASRTKLPESLWLPKS